MALSTREMYLVLHAKDMASSALRQFKSTVAGLRGETTQLDKSLSKMVAGGAMVAIGIGAKNAGEKILGFYKDSIDASIKFNQQAGYTATQLDKVKVSTNQLKDFSRQVANSIPVPFEQVQQSLYDVFSSMDVNWKGAQTLVRAFSKAAVAGQTDVSTASRATIGIMNSYGLAANKVNEVNDTMFQLVRKGVGTYSDFARAIGLAHPAAVQTGQDFKELAGMLAFLTRNGLSASRSATSAARAMELIAQPQVIRNLKDYGVQALKADGNLRPMSDIMADLGKKMKGLSSSKTNEVLSMLFKGAGYNIQARRFLSVAVKNYGELNKLVDDMHHSAGATQQAYNIMFKQPQSQVQILKNNIQSLKTTFGDALMPAVNAGLKILIKLAKWFNDQPAAVKKTIAIIGVVIGVLITLAGIALIVVGSILLLAGAFGIASIAMAGMEIALLPIIGIAALVIVALVAIIAAIILVVKYHTQIASFFKWLWGQIVGIWNTVKDAIVNFAKAAWTAISGFFSTVGNGIANFGKMIYGGFVSAINSVINFLKPAWNAVSGVFRAGWNIIVTIFKVMTAIVLTIVLLWWNFFGKYVWAGIQAVYKLFVKGFNTVKTFFIALWNSFKSIVRVGWNVIVNAFNVAKTTVIKIWHAIWNPIKAHIQAWWATIRKGFSIWWGWIKTGFGAFKTAVSKVWHAIWDPIKSHLQTWWAIIRKGFSIWWGWIKTGFNAFKTAISKIWHAVWDPIKSHLQNWWGSIKKGFNNFWSGIKNGFQSAKQAIIRIWDSIKSPMVSPVNFIIKQVWDNGIRKAWNTAVNLVGLGKKWQAPYVNPIKAKAGGLVHGPGGPKSDKVPALLSNKEFVVNAAATRMYYPLLSAINAQKLAGGGLVGLAKGIYGKSTGLIDFIMHPVDTIKKGIGKYVNLVKQIEGTKWGKVVGAVPRKVEGFLADKFKKLMSTFAGSGKFGAALAFAKSQVGKPYIWGGVGPRGYDCSGFMSVLTNVIRGKMPPYSRLFSTASFSGGRNAGGFVRNLPSAFMIGVAPGNHMAGTLLGQNVESYGGHGPAVGRGARGAYDGLFAYQFGLKAGAGSAAANKALAKKWAKEGATVGRKARGGMFSSGDWFVAGEEGRELIRAGRSGRVYPNDETEQMFGNGNKIEQNITINTQEINPAKHAADLGWELARRQS